MKPSLLLFLLLISLSITAFSQNDRLPQPWSHPVIRLMETRDTAVVWLKRRSDTATHVNLAVLHKGSHALYFFTRFGRLFDTLAVSPEQQAALLNKTLNAFTLYQQYYLAYFTPLSAAKAWLRTEGAASPPSQEAFSQVFGLPEVKKVASTFQKLLAIEAYERELQLLLFEFDWNPLAAVGSAVTASAPNQRPGSVITYQTPEGRLTRYRNADSLVLLQTAEVRGAADKMMFYDAQGRAVDSLTPKKGALKKLLAEKQDPFALYRGWLEWRLQALNEEVAALRWRLNYRLLKQRNAVSNATYSESITGRLRLLHRQAIEQEGELQNKIAASGEPDKILLHGFFQARYAGEVETKTWMGTLGWAVNTSFERGRKEYELTNHLGNVLVTVSDRKFGIDTDNNDTVDYYRADVVSAQDYYSFGAVMEQRKFSAGKVYRYGFNGKENDNDVKGVEGGQQDYGMRIYDPRLGRFLSVDPLTRSYPFYTPYSFAGNKPVEFIDRDGEEEGIDFAVRRREEAYLSGKITANQFSEQTKAMGISGLLAGAIVADIYIFKGRVTQLLLYSRFLGTLYHNKANSPEQIKERQRETFEAGVEVATALGIGKIFGGNTKLIRPSREIKVDLMGGGRSRYKDFINYDKNATQGLRDDVANFGKHFGSNTVSEIVANNPQAAFLDDVSDALKRGGLITVRGQMNNKFFNEIWNGTAKGLEGYEVVPNSRKIGLSTSGYTRSDGTPLQGGGNSLNEIILKKK